jgi:AAA15 family ATPase/GTPase
MLKSLRVTEFKSCRDTSITFGPLTVFVGPSAGGKSNLRDALRLVHGVGTGIQSGGNHW